MLGRSFGFIFWHFLAGFLWLSTAHAATITVKVLDSAGVGFNDTTPVAAVGGNDGTTVGEQRLNAFQYAADAIGDYLESNVPIVIDAQFAGLSCTASSGVLGSAGSKSAFRDFSNAPAGNTFYPGALANALVGFDLDSSRSDISASFNGDVGSTGCLESLSWYYGFDHNEPSGSLDFVAVLSHELLHGLGFSSFASVTTGAFIDSNNPTFAGIFDTFIFDSEQAKLWDSMSSTERVAAAINDPNLAWKGDNVTAASVYLTNGTKAVDITIVNASPITLKGDFVRLYAPNPVQQGSSVSHFTTDATPNLLMEPAINSDLFSSTIDLSQQLLKDIGWPFQATRLSDISVTLNSSVTEVFLGNRFNYTLVVSNNGQADATLIKTKLLLAADVSYQSASGSGWTCTKTAATTPEEIICELDSMIANGSSSAELILVITAPASGSGAFESSVTAATMTTEFNVANNSASQSVTLINNNEPVASDSSLLVIEDTATSATLSATDTDNNALTFSLVSNGTKGTAVIDNTATGAFTYTPTTGQTGQDSFTFKVNDGTVDSNTATVNVTINTADNTRPIASEGTLITAEDSAVSATLSATDADDDSLTFSLVSNGTKGTAVITNTTTGALTYTPSAGQTGQDSFSFKVNDGIVDSNVATMSITITVVNEAPVVSDASVATMENIATSAILSATDADNDSLTFSIVSNGAKGVATITNTATGAFTYTPTFGQTGQDSFTFKANDGLVDSNTGTVSISINALPVASNASVTTTVSTALSATLSATDADSDNLTFSIVNESTKGSVVITDTATGAFTYTPAATAGQDSFAFKVNDGLVDSNIATVTITINAVQTTRATSGEEIAVSTSAEGATVTELETLAETTGLISEQAATKPTDTTFPHGFIAYKIEGVTIGATVSIDIVFPSIPSNPKLYKVDASNGFVEFTHFTISGNTVTITLVDGGVGDADGVANGVIDDPLGLAEAPVVTGGNSLSGGGGSIDWLFMMSFLMLYGLRRYARYLIQV